MTPMPVVQSDSEGPDSVREGEECPRVCIAHGGDLGEPSGGTERVSALAAGLTERGLDVTLVVPTPSGPLPDRLAPVECVAVDAPSSSAARAVTVARAAARRARTDDAVLQLEHSTLAGVGSVLGLEEYVLDMHDLGYSRFDHVDNAVSPLMKRVVKRLERRALRRASHVVVVSPMMAEQIQRLWEVPSEKISVVPNGYFPETVEPFREVRTVEGRVVFLGTLHPKVDIETLVAIAELPTVTEMIVVGDGARRGHLEDAAERVQSLRTTGRLPDSDAFQLVASAAAVVNPQTVSDIQRSSSPVKLYYYAALGKPIVATPGPSFVSKLVRRNAAITAQSRRHFLDRVDAVLHHDEFATRLTENALRVADEVTWSTRIDSLEVLHTFGEIPSRGFSQ